MWYSQIIMLAVAVTVDGFFAGMACGFKGVKIKLPSLLVIACISALAVVVAGIAGQGFSGFIPVEQTGRVGGAILVLLGGYFTGQALKDYITEKQALKDYITEKRNLCYNGEYEMKEINKNNNTNNINNNNRGSSNGENTNNSDNDDNNNDENINGVRGISLLFRDPSRADADKSGTLSAGEALFLGIALGADALGAGFAAVLMGMPVLLMALSVGLAKLFLVFLGVSLGRLISPGSLSRYGPVISGFLLIIIGAKALLY